MRILMVDNHPEFTATVIQRFLSEHEVTVVPTVRAAIVASRSAPDVVLVDYDLDDGKGDAFIKDLRAAGSRLPVVAISAREDGNSRLMRAGADATCSKLEFARIREVVAGVLGDKRR